MRIIGRSQMPADPRHEWRPKWDAGRELRMGGGKKGFSWTLLRIIDWCALGARGLEATRSNSKGSIAKALRRARMQG